MDSLSSFYLLIEHLFLKEAKCSFFFPIQALKTNNGMRKLLKSFKVNLTRPVKKCTWVIFLPRIKKKNSKLYFVYICLKKMEAVYRILKNNLHTNIKLNYNHC